MKSVTKIVQAPPGPSRLRVISGLRGFSLTVPSKGNDLIVRSSVLIPATGAKLGQKYFCFNTDIDSLTPPHICYENTCKLLYLQWLNFNVSPFGSFISAHKDHRLFILALINYS